MRVESSFVPHFESNRRSHDAIHHTAWSNPNPTMQHKYTNPQIQNTNIKYKYNMPFIRRLGPTQPCIAIPISHISHHLLT